jgi:hypothetical protein
MDSDDESFLNQCMNLLDLSDKDICDRGWEVVYNDINVQVFKRKHSQTSSSEYLIIGNITSVSPRVFIRANADYSLRKEWDNVNSKY